MKKAGLIILLIIGLFLAWEINLSPTYTSYCYPHDNLVKIMDLCSFVITAIACIVGIVFTIKGKFKKILAAFIIGYVLIPFILSMISNKIEDYDVKNYEGSNCVEWHDIGEH